MKLTTNFTLEEMTRSSSAAKLGIRNVPTVQQIENLRLLCKHLLQPLRDGYGKPLNISSGFRCRSLNEAVGGSPTSDHLHGLAADIATSNPMALFAWVCRLNLPFDQAIIGKGYLHLSWRTQARKVCFAQDKN
ncbi:zinc D-Ala-D-Ala carboxypeptidase [Dysgonomonadaceae bacterium PH5-43]|nr:zinc D-Ala-D-Ala carboxypeptidase [Dysgonomonadaceae bacterium PH5-43]